MVALQIRRQKAKEQRYTANNVRQFLMYDPETGDLTWRVMKGNMLPGSKAGKLKKRGYIDVKLDRHYFRAHRLIWLIQTGEWPENVIDHIDRDKANNKWLNLRDCTQSQNCRNSKRSK